MRFADSINSKPNLAVRTGRALFRTATLYKLDIDTSNPVEFKLPKNLNSVMFLVGASWLFSAQIVSRIARLMTTLVVARVLSPEHFGIVAIALTVNEFAMVVSRYGTTTALIKSDDHLLENNCRTAWSLNWTIGVTLLVIQCILAGPIANLYSEPGITGPIMVLSIVYLLLPIGAVNQALTARRGDMKTVAKAEVWQAIVDAFLTVSLAFAGFGIWALILPKILVVPIWIFVHQKASPWADRKFQLAGSSSLLKFGVAVAGTEILTVIRHSIDYILIGFFLGIEALGIYFFAFNAGLGITKSLLTAMTNALLPSLCRAGSDKEQQKHDFMRAVSLIMLLISTWVAMQVSLAAWYVPLIFGDKWVENGALPILMIICLCGIPLALTETCSQYMRARGVPNRDFYWNIVYTVVFTACVSIGMRWGITGVAYAILGASLINMPIYYHLNVKPILRVPDISSELVPTPLHQ
jgi:PST family polysaccharide transporter